MGEKGRDTQVFDEQGHEIRPETVETLSQPGWGDMKFSGKLIQGMAGWPFLEMPGGEAAMGTAVLLHEFMTPLEPGDLVMRPSDGAWFRVSGKRLNKAYTIGGKTFACVPVERVETPEAR